MKTVAIVGNGPHNHLPDFISYQHKVDIWISADGGALNLINEGIHIDYAVGDFDSINEKQYNKIQHHANRVETYPKEKNETDLEIALKKAIELKPSTIILFGITGGRLDHSLINIQLLQKIHNNNICGLLIDQWNQVELTHPGTHHITEDKFYPYISFIPLTNEVKNISLSGFRYPLTNYNLTWGSTRCISNELTDLTGTCTYESGILLLIKSRDIELE